MSFLDVWIGDFNEQRRLWDLQGGPILGTVHSGFFPPCCGTHFHEVIKRIRDRRYEGKQLDWGSFGARVSKRQIEEFIEDIYGADSTYQPGTSFPWLLEKLVLLKQFVRDLDPDRPYILVATEL